MAVERIVPETNDYIEILFHLHRYLSIVNIVRDQTVLDIASGEGYGSNILASHASYVVGVDIDENSVSMAGSKYIKDNLEFIHANATKIPFPDDYFDVVVSFETIEHLNELDQKIFLSEIKRVLKDRGVIIMSTPDKNRTEKFTNKNMYHIREFYKEEFTEFLFNEFNFVNLFYQEVNLSSIIWNELSLNKASIASVDIENQRYSTRAEQLNDHLYIIAVFSQENIINDIDLTSFCYDYLRTPINSIWSENILNSEELNLLRNDYARVLEENNHLLSEIDSSLIEINKYKDLCVVKDDVISEQTNSLKFRDEQISRNKKRIKLLVTKSIENENEIRRLMDYRSQMELNEAGYRESLAELSHIKNMRTWKFVVGYRRFMDNTLIGRMLRILLPRKRER